MVGISRLLSGREEPSDRLRYAVRAGPRKPIVVWNLLRRCNLRCMHCYARASEAGDERLTSAEGDALLRDLAHFGAPVVLFSGGEPLLHPDIFALVARASELGLRAVLSTNGTLITAAAAARLRGAGIGYVGVSLDGTGEVNDRFRGMDGAFEAALSGIRRCREAGVKVGLRFTITRRNVAEIPAIFDLLKREEIPRVCFYHLVYAGRGADIMSEDLDAAEARATMDAIIDRTQALLAAGRRVEVLTVDNHADGPYLWLRMAREGNPRAESALAALERNGGNASGSGIACVGWDGAVYADQFWRHTCLGNVRRRPFSKIWTDESQPLLSQLRDRRRRLKGRCAQCRFLPACGGNFRVRAEAATGDLWAPDPACYLTDNETRAPLHASRPA